MFKGLHTCAYKHMSTKVMDIGLKTMVIARGAEGPRGRSDLNMIFFEERIEVRMGK